jgi:hypothetical protein
MVTRLFHDDSGSRQHKLALQDIHSPVHFAVFLPGKKSAVFESALLACVCVLSTIFVSLSQQWLEQHLHIQMPGIYTGDLKKHQYTRYANMKIMNMQNITVKLGDVT